MVHGMMLGFEKAKNTEAARVFYAFLKSRNIPRVWNRVTEHGKNNRYFLVKDFRSACSKPAYITEQNFHKKPSCVFIECFMLSFKPLPMQITLK